ncbi:MAG: hypothetical protein IAC61_00610 [Firmicutes bacterium]|uniref:Uncharacterized protein n=1 Tax=Candidatus Alloenteromonas pullistercoris TaxID=2840785 RepID=A0A9D9DEL9_9FIRM|nr:hypothetical protein [Candidatus Enteromonas pullistercoris]
MKKGMLALLLLFPFLIAFLAFTTSDYLIKGVEQDIDDIEIEYPSLAPFGLKQGKVKLEAESVYNEDYPLSEGNDLVFSVPLDQEVARIDEEEDGYYFVPLSEGQVEVTVSNRKGNVSRSFIALVYGESGALVVNLDCPFSSAGMASYHWGTYDIVYDSLSSPYYKHTAKFTFSAEVVGNDAMDVFDFTLSYSDNLSIDLANSEVTVLAPGESYISFTHPFSTSAPETRLEFNAVEAVNVYSYADLLKATNLSETGEAVVLHLDLESESNYERASSKKQMGIFGEIEGKVDPESYVYRFQTTYNHDFLDLWAKQGETEISDEVIAGIRLRQSLYGNGFLINGHDLCYPSSSQKVNGVIVPALKPGEDIFRGPRIYAAAGDPFSPYYEEAASNVEPLMVIYGQDNSLLYVEGDGVRIDNLRLKNADFGDNYQNLSTVGTGIDIKGDGTTISNSVISSARTLIRAFGDAEIDNCLLQNSLEFGVKAGSDLYSKPDPNKEISYSDPSGAIKKIKAKDYLSSIFDSGNLTYETVNNGLGDSILSAGICYNNQTDVFVNGTFGDGLFSRDRYSKQTILAGADSVQDALSNLDGFVNDDGSKNYDTEVTVSDSFFYNIHIAPICLDSYANGPFLYNATSILFRLVLGIHFSFFPSGCAPTMAPTKLTLEGDNRFYTYQKAEDLSFDSLAYQNIAFFIKEHGDISIKPEVTEDDYLPLSSLLTKQQEAVYVDIDGQSYLNTPIMKMGGGTNLSEVAFEDGGFDFVSLDCYEYNLGKSSTFVDDSEFMSSDEARYTTMKVALSRAASNFFGFEDYVFYHVDKDERPYFGQTPSLSELASRS